MSGKQPSQIFQKRHFNPDKFIEDGSTVSGTSAENIETVREDHVTVPTAAVSSTSVPAGVAREKPRKIPMTYKHKEQNYERLKWLSQRLKVPMGDLIDEALEAKFADWRLQVPHHPEPQF